MRTYPFYIDKLTLDNQDISECKICTYLVKSNAPISVETNYSSTDNTRAFGDDSINLTYERIHEIARFLRDNADAEVVIHIHGYNTREQDFKNWVDEIYRYIIADKFINKKTIAFIGYRWPSEYISFKAGDGVETVAKNFQNAIRSLPVFYKSILDYSLWGLIFSLLLVLLFIIPFADSALLFDLPSFLVALISLMTAFFAILFGFVICAIVLRATIYFRDNYRAINYGVPDLVEFIRQIDNAIVDQTPGSTRFEKKLKLSIENNNRIKLSFISHSMGAFVTTNVIRILSDVFDENSIQIPDKIAGQTQPSPGIGSVFSLGRLVLASPDIPIETIMPERTNFLRSSLRRFDESYVFTNQGDILLRVASTAANYLSFPANTYDRGFRLGNIIVKDKDKKLVKNDSNTNEKRSFGIANQNPSNGCVDTDTHSAMKYLGIVSDGRQKALEELYSVNNPVNQKNAIASLFSYFDCTDYKDATDENAKVEGILTRALQKEILTYRDNVFLIFDNLFTGKDVHGGYFKGKFTKKMLYRLAFLGFTNFLTSLEDEPDYQELINSIQPQFQQELVQASLQAQSADADTQKEAMIKYLRVLSQQCQNKGIKVFLSPERYEVDILGKQRDRRDY